MLRPRPRAKVIDIKSRKPVFTKVLVSRAAFFDMADAVAENIGELRLQPEMRNTAINTLKEMKFVSCFNHEFRNNTYPELEEFLYELYERVHAHS